jgi:hypothetical protein
MFAHSDVIEVGQQWRTLRVKTQMYLERKSPNIYRSETCYERQSSEQRSEAATDPQGTDKARGCCACMNFVYWRNSRLVRV